jgi:hypothetical protein
MGASTMNTYFYPSVFISLAISLSASAQTTSNVWGSATNDVKMSIMPTHDVSSFSADDVKDWSALIARLRRQSDPVSAFLWRAMSNNEQVVLTTYQPSLPCSKEAEDVVVQALNRIIRESLIYNEERFKGISLDAKAARILGRAPLDALQGGAPGTFFSHINRLLLEDAYPVELSRPMKDDEPTFRKSEPVELTVTITNMSTNETYYASTGVLIEVDARFLCQIITPSGKRLSPAGDHSLNRNQIPVVLDPNETRTHTWEYNVSRIYTFDEIGTYTITISRVLDWPGGKKETFTVTYPDGGTQDFTMDAFITVVSNPLFIKIIPDK